MKKILVIGAGDVGVHIIQYGIMKGLDADFYLLDVNDSLEKAQILDLKDTLPFSANVRITGLDFGDPRLQEMDIVVITAGSKQAPGETRCELLSKNRDILSSISTKLGTLSPQAIVLLVTNPVDILTHLAYRIFDLPKTQIFGTGTLLDSARLQRRLAENCKIDLKNVRGYVLGEHGDSQFVAWSTVRAGRNFTDPQKAELETEVREAAYEIISGKGSTYFGIGAATSAILQAILQNTGEILPVSTVYPHIENSAVNQTPLGIPAKIGTHGIMEVPALDLADSEVEKLIASAEKLKQLYEELPAE